MKCREAPDYYASVVCVFSLLKPKFHYVDFPVTSATSPQQTRDVPFRPNSITPTSPKLSRMGTNFGEVGVVEFGLEAARLPAPVVQGHERLP